MPPAACPSSPPIEFDRPRADSEIHRYHLVGIAAQHSVQHIAFARADPGDALPCHDPRSGSFEAHGRRAIYLLIHSRNATIERVAENLGLHVRTLQRTLDKDGLSFAERLNDVRRELALRYLASEYHSIATVAHLAGYSRQSAFARRFAAEFGSTPATWRNGGRRQAQALA